MRRFVRPFAFPQRLAYSTATKEAAPAAAAAATAAKPSKPAPFAAFEKILGTAAVNEVHQCGDHIRVYVDSGIFAWVVMDRKGSSANALGEAFMDSATKAMDLVDKLVAENKAKLAIITSAKDTFCVGADIEQLYPVTDVDVARKASQAGQKFFDRIETTKYPVIAAVNGLALGGGCELALACHHRVLASEKANMGLPETLLGLLPGAGGTVRLPRLVGIQASLKMILTGAAQKPDRCKKMGLVDAVVPSADRFQDEFRFIRGARAFATKYVERPLKPSKAKPKSIKDRILEETSFGRSMIAKESLKMLNKLTKGKYQGQYKALECVLFSASHAKSEAMDFESKKFAELMVTPEAKNQIALYFLDDGMKKLEKKTGMSADQIPKVKKIGVIGAGVMGSGVAHFCALKDHAVYMKDLKQEYVDKGMGFVKSEFETALKRKKMDKKKFNERMALVTAGTSDDELRTCDVIVEAAVEVMDIKKKMLQDLEAAGILDGKRLFATNTSSLSLTELQAVSKYPECIVGMHFFNPVAKMPLVEVIKGKHTSKEAVATIFQLSLKIGKKPIIVNDGPGFLVNRILGAYMAEAGRLVRDGADPQVMDKAIVNFGMPMGPLRLLDEVGLDVACHVGPVLQNGLKSDRFAVDTAVEAMMKDGNLGKKNKKGFYNYDEKGKEQGMNMSLAKKYLTTPIKVGFPEAEIVDRCVLMMVNEATLILQEGICERPEDVDIGMVWGTGFAPFRGGLLQYADHRGAANIVTRMEELASKCGDRFQPSAMLKDMAKGNKRFFPDRPMVPYKERHGFPSVKF
eukprot:PhM_4_TR10363/c1_g1_i1/m.27448/K01782/fadJ; 3-hydroxyacyl-CoA dehydrogenase / enoyl-CoA hydratase / 3-hydroxybutyryl-CoA epimerase